MADEPPSIEPTCPQCGAHLVIEQWGAAPSAEDVLSCPVHGPVMNRRGLDGLVEEARARQIADEVARQVFGLLGVARR